MAIILSLQVGNPDVVFADLVDIVRCDAGLTATEPTLFARQVSYTQKQGAVASSSRILELVNSPVPVIISGVGYSHVIPDVGAISDSAGLTRTRTGADTSISIWYDITDAAGQHWTVKDQDSQDIYLPRQVLLYHELAHAYHDIKGDLGVTRRDREIQAIADENVFRGQLGLTLRNSTYDRGGPGTPSHGGVTFPKCSPEKKGWSPGWKCPAVVATAALGSPDAAEITALRRARAEYRSMGLWGALVAQPALDLYGRFGPPLARVMQEQPALRDAVLSFVVQPTLHLLTTAEAYLGTDADTPALARTVDLVLDGYLAQLAETPWPAGALAEAADDAVAAAGMLAAGATPAPLPPRSRPPAYLFSGIAREILAVDGRPPAVFAWAFEGIAAFLRGAARHAGGPAAGGPAAGHLLPELGAWVAGIPLPPPSELRAADAHRELAVLAGRILTRPETRDRFARRLLAQWTDGPPADLRLVLGGLGYLTRPRSEVDHG